MTPFKTHFAQTKINNNYLVNNNSPFNKIKMYFNTKVVFFTIYAYTFSKKRIAKHFREYIC